MKVFGYLILGVQFSGRGLGTALFSGSTPNLLQPSAPEETDEEDGTTERQFNGHGRPHTAQSVTQGESGGQG